MAPFSSRFNHDEIKIIGVCGGSGSGKTTFAKLFGEYLQQKGLPACAVLAQDNYYIDQSDRFDGDGGAVNFDHPDALDFPLMSEHLERLKNKQSVQVPLYDFAVHKRLTETIHLKPAPLIIVDGILILSQENIRRHFYTSVFLDIPEEVRFQRRLNRDVHERGRQPEGVQKQFMKQVKPMHDLFVQPSKEWAHWVIPDNQLIYDYMEKIILDLVRPS